MFKHRPLKFLFRNFLKFVVILSLLFIIYQLSLFNQLTGVFKKHNLIRGTHNKQGVSYVPDQNEMFRCVESGERIQFTQINDNYCDCLDGTDEPGTNACPNGIFYCTHQLQNVNRKTRNFIPSSMVNDGICDCCDGSDEWANNVLSFRLSDTKQRELGRYQTPCPNTCSNK